MGKHFKKRGNKDFETIDMIRKISVENKNPKLKARNKFNLLIF